MVFDARGGHRLRFRDVCIIAKEKDPNVGDVLCKELPWPEFPICVRPCLKRMIVATVRIETMNENKAVRRWLARDNIGGRAKYGSPYSIL